MNSIEHSIRLIPSKALELIDSLAYGPEYIAIAGIVSFLRPKTLLELGTEFGRSTAIFKLCYPPAEILTVDIDPKCEENVKHFPGVRFLCSDTKDLELTEDFDVMFVDSLHTYDRALDELNRFSPLIKYAIMLHDICSFPGVELAIQEFLRTNSEDWNYDPYPRNHGLGVLWRRLNGRD